MKKNLFSWQGWSAAHLSFAVLLGVFGNPALAQAASPVGTWDCLLSGHRAGTAYLTFINAEESTSRGTFTGIEVLVPNNPSATVVGEGRNSGGADTRGGTTTPPTPPPSGQQIFGYNGPNGPWALDNQGRLIGEFIEVSQLENCVTNAFPTGTTNTSFSLFPISVTNAFCSSDPSIPNLFSITTPIATNVVSGVTNYTEQEICYTNIIVCQAITNAISFVGRVVPGRRLTLMCTTPFGNTIYQGVPAKVLPDISGDWYGTKKQAGIVYQEFLTLSPSGFPFPNVYDVVGTGPGYSYSSNNIAILSSRRKISFVLGMDPPFPTNQFTDIRAVTGPFNPRTVTATTKGYDQPAGVFTNPVSFKATRFGP